MDDIIFGVVEAQCATKTCRAVFSAMIARRLLKSGHRICDIKQNRGNPEKTVFYFELTPEFEADFKSATNGYGGGG